MNADKCSRKTSCDLHGIVGAGIIHDDNLFHDMLRQDFVIRLYERASRIERGHYHHDLVCHGYLLRLSVVR